METDEKQEQIDELRQQLARAHQEAQTLRERLRKSEARSLDNYALLRDFIDACDSGAIEGCKTIDRIEAGLAETVAATDRGKASLTVVFEIAPRAPQEPAELRVKIARREQPVTGPAGLRYVEAGSFFRDKPGNRQQPLFHEKG